MIRDNADGTTDLMKTKKKPRIIGPLRQSQDSLKHMKAIKPAASLQDTPLRSSHKAPTEDNEGNLDAVGLDYRQEESL